MINNTPGITSGSTIDTDTVKLEDQFSNLVNNVKEYAIFITDPKGFIQTWNEGAKSIKEYSAGEIIGQHMSVFYTMEDQKKLLPEKLMEEARIKGDARNEGWRVRKDGSRFWGDVVITTLFDGKKMISGFSHITSDLSSKHYQKEFDKNNLQALINNTQDLMWSVDTKYNFITSNHAFDKVIRQMVNKPIEKRSAVRDSGFNQKQLNKYIKYYDRALSGEIFTEIEYTDAPHESWVEISFHPICEAGIIVGTACHAHDVTGVTKVEIERKKNEEKLKKSELRLQGAQRMAHVGSWELDFSTGIAEWSEEMLRIYGLAPEDSRQTYKSWLSFIHPDDVDHVRRATAKSKITPANHAFFHRIVRRDGTVRHIYSHAHVQFNNEGTPVLLYGIGHDVTEIKEAEEALRESESNLQAIFQNTSEGFVLTDTHGIVKAFNNNARESIFMNTEQEIKIDNSIFNYVHESRKEIYKDSISKVLSGETLRYDYAYQRKNGETKWFDFIVNPVYNKGKIVELSITSSDITERKEAEEFTRKSASNIKAIIENTDATIYSLDSNLRYITFNKRLEITMKQLYGLDIKPGDNAYDFLNKFDPVEAGSWREIYAKALKGEPVKFEKEFSIDDYYNYSAFSIHPIWENQTVIGLSCFVLDITKQKQAENEQRKSEARYRQIVETANEGIWLINADNKATFVNQKMCKIFEYSQEEMLGKDIYYFMDAGSKYEASKSMVKKAKDGGMEMPFITKSGKHIWTNISASSIFDDDGKYKGLLAMVTNITERKILQQQLFAEQVNKHKDITKAVVNAQEKERREIGVELHDNINQLLATSKLYLGHSLKVDDGKSFVLQSQEYISTAMDEIRKLSHAFVGPSLDKNRGLIDSLKELINNLSIVKNINFNFNHSTYCEEDTEAGLKIVIYRIIQEQLNNVIKHAEASKVDIALKIETGILQVIINDNGIGFDTTAKRDGIGLSNIKNRAEVYNGVVQIISSPGNGCKMSITF